MAVRLATPEYIACMHRIGLSVRENRLSDPALVTLEDYLPAITSLGCGWGAVSARSVVGFAVGYRNGNVWALFVDPDHEGHGHGKALHSAMVAWLWKQGLKEIRLTTTPGTRAETFYRNQGWTGNTVTGGQVRLQLSNGGSLT